MENIPNSEKNLSLERQEAVKLHNEILAGYNDLQDKTNKEATEKVSEMEKIRENVRVIDQYKSSAKSFSDQYYYRVGDISNVEKLNKEKEKVDKEVEKIKSWIRDDTVKLNELRKKLGMEDSNDIPSLDIKKERLPYLLNIQSDLQNKLSFKEKKLRIGDEENTENKKLENRNLQVTLQDMASSIKSFASALEDKQAEGNAVEEFRNAARSLESVSSDEELISTLNNLGNKFALISDVGDLDFKSESFFGLSSSVNKFLTVIENIPQSIKNEEKRQEVSRKVSYVTDEAQLLQSFLARKAQAIKDYEDVSLPR